MLVLHASLTVDGDLLAWAQPARDGDEPIGHDELADVIARMIGVDAVVETASARLPNVDGFIDHELAVARLTPIDAVALLSACRHDQRLPLPGVQPAAELAPLGLLARVAGAVVLRQELLPSARWTTGDDESLVACWDPMPGPQLRDATDAAARALPECVRAFGAQAASRAQLGARFVARIVDELVRSRLADGVVEITTTPAASLHDRWLDALRSLDPRIEAPRDALDGLREELGRWQQRLRRMTESAFRVCLRLEEPDDPTDDERNQPWQLRVLLQLREDPSVVIDAAEALEPSAERCEQLARHSFHAGEHLVAPLGEIAHLFEPIADALRAGSMTGCEVDTAGAHEFLSRIAPLAESMGFGVFVPAWWRSRGGRFTVGVRAQVRTELTGGRRTLDALNLATLVEYDWRLALGDETMSRSELTKLAAQKAKLVHVRGRWIELDPDELRAALAHLERLEADPTTPLRGARAATVSQLLATPAVTVTDATGSDLLGLLARAAKEQTPDEAPVPAGLAATLRPYQLRGFAWLASMSRLGLGACLADDMGLGKTVQALAAIQHAWETDPTDERGPTLLVCPTSVLTNWLRETERFTPELPVLVHHGSGRARGAELAEQVASAGIVITSYALLARDAAALQQVAWRSVVLDEAQNIKNPGTRHAVAARSLRTSSRIALTGTPVENHVGDLWSIMEFLNPGLLGSQADFRRRYLLPIQSGSFPEAVERLQRLTSPFIMRRMKSDPDIVPDLPDRLESTTFCSLTPEQVTLYEAIVREAATNLRMGIRDARRSGIERRGMILATISRLKQVCNHPAQLLGDNSAAAGRSGKLARLEQLAESILEQGERALVFTQFVTMGRILQSHLAEVFGREVLLLHGGTKRTERDRIVERFQDPGIDAPPLLVLSLKAGGSGLNLTAATHVIHFDRWWNPAVEQQATDRAHRIGQDRDVQVHAMVCAGTVEERIDRMLRQKREVAGAVVGSGEQWIGELDDDELLDLLELRRDTLLQAARLDDIDAKEWQRAVLR
jgi:superfamily II DNA or RNA helicase